MGASSMEVATLGNPRKPFTLSALFECAGVSARGLDPHVGETWPHVTRIVDDSRDAHPGCCFVAVRGMHVDGHDYVPRAVEAGASVVVVERDAPVPDGVVRLTVPDSRLALAKLAAAWYGLYAGQQDRFFDQNRPCQAAGSNDALQLIGVTGTNGKTTVAWLVRSILRAADVPAAMLGTIEYDLVARRLPAPLTTPKALDLCRCLAEAKDAGAQAAVMEVSSHALDQRRCDGLSFSAGVFTNLSGEHLDYHGTLERYAAAKRRLFDLIRPGGAAVVNIDDPVGERIARSLRDAGRVRLATFGIEQGHADFTATVHDMSLRGSRVSVRFPSHQTALSLPLIGRHNVLNALAAIAVAETMGIERRPIGIGLASFDGVPGRLQRVEPEACPFAVLVDYAHTDAALANALDSLRPLTRKRLICVFGCGGERDRGKRPRMGAAVGARADLAFVTSDNPRGEDPLQIIEEILPGFHEAGGRCREVVEPDRRRAIEMALAEAADGDTVLIAGKGHETYQLIGRATVPFDDAAVVREWMDRNMPSRIGSALGKRGRC